MTLENVLESKINVIDGIVGFRTKDLMNYTIIQSKVGLRDTDTKRVWDSVYCERPELVFVSGFRN